MFSRSRSIFFILLGCLPFYCNAIYIDAMTFDIPDSQEFISKNIINNTKTTQRYTISAIAIDRPGPNEKSSRIENGEILYTPLNFILQPGKFEYFKIFYRGPKDNKERYYRINFSETPIEMMEYSEANKKTQVMPSISLSTILVVRPRKLDFKYQYDAERGTLTNTGNTYFSILIHKGCVSNDDKAYSMYLLPGQTLREHGLRGNNRKFIVALDRYYPFGTQCENAEE